MGFYELKVVAEFAERHYRQKAKHSFTVKLVDYCANAVLSDPGQKDFAKPIDYFYDGLATYTLEPFDVSPPECLITYSCAEDIFGFCNHSSETTQSFFDEELLELSLQTEDIKGLGTQIIKFTITGVGESSNIKKGQSIDTDDISININ